MFDRCINHATAPGLTATTKLHTKPDFRILSLHCRGADYLQTIILFSRQLRILNLQYYHYPGVVQSL